MIALGPQHVVEALRFFRRFAHPEYFHLVHALEVEADGTFLAVDLEAVVVLAARREARRLHRADRAVLEFDRRDEGVVHVHLARAFAVRQRALFDERARQRAHTPELADEEPPEVNDARAEVAERAAAAHLPV